MYKLIKALLLQKIKESIAEETRILQEMEYNKRSYERSMQDRERMMKIAEDAAQHHCSCDDNKEDRKLARH